MADKDKKDENKDNSSQSTQKKRHGADGKVSLPRQVNTNRRWT